jgi:hypothetical protein
MNDHKRSFLQEKVNKIINDEHKQEKNQSHQKTKSEGSQLRDLRGQNERIKRTNKAEHMITVTRLSTFKF